MPNYRIRLTTTAYVDTAVNITADTEKEAKEEAKKMGRSGDVEWIYDGLVDRNDIFIEECEEVE